MPVPEGFITTSKIWTGEAEPPLPEEPTEVEEKEQTREEVMKDIFEAFNDYNNSSKDEDDLQ